MCCTLQKSHEGLLAKFLPSFYDVKRCVLSDGELLACLSGLLRLATVQKTVFKNGLIFNAAIRWGKVRQSLWCIELLSQSYLVLDGRILYSWHNRTDWESTDNVQSGGSADADLHCVPNKVPLTHVVGYNRGLPLNQKMTEPSSSIKHSSV